MVRTKDEKLRDGKLVVECVELLNKKLEKFNLEIEVRLEDHEVRYAELAIIEKTKPLKTMWYRCANSIDESVGEMLVGQSDIFTRAKMFGCGELGKSGRFDDALDFLEKFANCNSLEELELRLEIEGE